MEVLRSIEQNANTHLRLSRSSPLTTLDAAYDS